jgi:hypothetical protein
MPISINLKKYANNNSDILPHVVQRIFVIQFSCYYFGYAVAQLVEALRYKPECREVDFRWGRWDFSLT